MATYDFYVSAVRYNSDNTHIEALRVHEAQPGGTTLKAAREMTRPQVVTLIKQKKTFCTMVKGSDDQWKVGAPLLIVSVTTDYLKTKNDTSTKDNLENLPPI